MGKTEDCNLEPCPVDCELSDWTVLEECSSSCGVGQRKLSRTVITPAAHGGQCGAQEKTEECSLEPCPVDCVLSDWTVLEDCATTCGVGQRTLSRTVITPAAHGGQCDAQEKT